MTKLYLVSTDHPNPARPVGAGEVLPQATPAPIFSPELPEAVGIFNAALAGVALLLVAIACMVVL